MKWFNVAKGWGFLTPINLETRALEKEKEVFVHQVRERERERERARAILATP